MPSRSQLWVALAAVALTSGCAVRRAPAFRIVPAAPEYLLEAPDASRTPFGDILPRYAGADSGWADMRPGMALHVERAYFREGAAEQNIRSYLGTETVRYRSREDGTLAETDAGPPLEPRPAGQASARSLLGKAQQQLPHHRFFFQLLVNPTEDRRAAVLLSAPSRDELTRLADALVTDAAATCQASPESCTIFPENCSVSLEMEITVNDATTVVAWGTRLARVADGRPDLELHRLNEGRQTRVELDGSDLEALRIPLLPGDRVKARKR